MKPLPKTFTGRGEVKGFLFTRILASDMAYLYEVEAGSMKHYEVFKKRENARYGVISYPTSKAFGYWAWTYKEQVKAIQKLVSFIKEKKDGEQKK